MSFATTLLFYLTFGVATSIALVVREQSPTRQLFPALAAVFFWPVFIPMLLGSNAQQNSLAEIDPRDDQAADDMGRTIAQVERELEQATSRLDGWAEGVLSREKVRLAELATAWRSQAARIREMDRIVAEFESVGVNRPSEANVGDDSDRVARSKLNRLANMDRLRQVRNRAHRDLLGTLAWVRELVTMIHLAKFTGAPVSRAEELISQIAASVEGLAEVNAWAVDDQIISRSVNEKTLSPVLSPAIVGSISSPEKRNRPSSPVRI